MYQLLIGAATLAEVCIHTEFGFDILPANRELAGAEVELIELSETRISPQERAASRTRNLRLHPDRLPPGTQHAHGQRSGGIRFRPDSDASASTTRWKDCPTSSKHWRKVRAHLNSRLEIEGLLRTMYNAQSTLTQQVSNELENHFGNKVYKTIVPRNVRLAEAPSYGKPVIAFDKNSKGALAYSALAKEILERITP